MKSSIKLMATSLYILICLTGFSRCAVTAPRHTATRENVSVQFHCIPDASDEYIQWFEFASSAEGSIIFNPLKTDDYDKNKYLFSNDGRNFTIKLPSMNSAGRYECRTLATPGNYPAELIVLQSPVCHNEGRTVAKEGQRAKLRCSVGYTGNKVVSLKWYNEEGRELQDQYNGDKPGIAMTFTNFTLRDIDDDTHPNCTVTVADTEYTDYCTIIPSLRVRSNRTTTIGPATTTAPILYQHRCQCEFRLIMTNQSQCDNNLTNDTLCGDGLPVFTLPEIPQNVAGESCNQGCNEVIGTCLRLCSSSALELWSKDGLYTRLPAEPGTGHERTMGQMLCERVYINIEAPGAAVVNALNIATCNTKFVNTWLGGNLCCLILRFPAIGTIPFWDHDCSGVIEPDEESQQLLDALMSK